MAGKDSPGRWTLPGYEHVQQLGTGAGGQVFLARHQHSGTLVAVKYLVPGLHADGDFREAYRSEAQLLAELESPHVTRLYEYVEGPVGAAIVMEAVAGSSLRQLMKQEGATTPEAALCILKGSLLGLAAAHDAGVVHRDYKPANVLVTPDGISKLVDFGIAARSGEAVGAAGTPLYMAPEQFHGAPASPAADVYAATVTFFECVTGTRPFAGKNAVELMAQHSLNTVPEESVPEPLRPLIRAGMAKHPQERPPSALAFVAALEQVAFAAYGPEWEERGQRKIATLLALLPLLLLEGAAQPVPASTTSIATTVLGSGAGAEAGAELGTLARRRSRAIRATVGVGAAGAIVVAVVAVAAASGRENKQAAANADSALVGATTMLTPFGSGQPSALLSKTPTATASASSSASPSASPSQSSATPTVGQGTASSAATSSSSPNTSPTSVATSTTAPPTHSTSPTTPPPTPQVDSISVNSLTCNGTLVTATVTITTNGVAGGSATFTWISNNDNGSQSTVGTSPITLAAGQTTQSFTSPQENFRAYSGAVNWGVTVSSSPASKGGNSSAYINPYTNGCVT